MHDSSSTTDGERMRRWAAGDRTAFEEIVHAWQYPIGRFLIRLTGDCEDASDLTQEVFLRVYLRGAQYREAGTFRTWHYQIALNLARDTARRKARRPVMTLEESHDSPKIAELHDGVERAALVAAALTELPLAQREVVVLRH